MGEVTVELDPASVSGSIEARDGMPCAGRLAAVHPEIALAAECGRRRGGRDLEVARETRIAAGQPRRVEGGRILDGPAPELSKDTAGVTPVAQWAELSRRPRSGQGSSRPFKPGYTAPHRRRCVCTCW